MNPADWALLGGVGLMSLLSLWRGFLHQLLGFSSLLLAGFFGWYGKETVGERLSNYVASPLLQHVLGFCIIFLAIMIGGLVLGKLLGFIVRRAGLGSLDRFLGFVFGLALGLVLAWGALASVRALLPAIAQETWWQESLLITPILEHGDRLLLERLPKLSIDIPPGAIPQLPPLNPPQGTP